MYFIGGFEWYVDLAPDEELWSRWTAAGCVSGLMHEQGMVTPQIIIIIIIKFCRRW